MTLISPPPFFLLASGGEHEHVRGEQERPRALDRGEQGAVPAVLQAHEDGLHAGRALRVQIRHWHRQLRGKIEHFKN